MQQKNAMDIDVKELKERLDKGDQFVFIDVREPHEYEEANLGAQLIPMGSIPHRMSEIEAGKDDEIVVHCRSGARSANVQRFLQSHGYTNVRNLTGGILAYIDSFGMPDQS